MSKDLREAAELVLAKARAIKADDASEVFVASALLAAVYLAANPADDDELADADFVGKIIRDDKDCVIVQMQDSFEMRVQVVWETDWTKKKWRCVVRAYRHSFIDAIIVETPTRGHVRRLLAALGAS